MPNNAINPTRADTDKFSPAMASPKMPPTAAKGTTIKIKNASEPESKATNNKKKIAVRVMGTITSSRRTARCWFSNAPVHSMR